MSIYKAMAAKAADPKFVALGYQEQRNERKNIVTQYLSADPSFLKLDAETQRNVYLQTMSSYDIPALEDKKLEKYIDALVQGGRNGNAEALSLIEGLVNANAMSRSSVFGSLIGKYYEAIGGMSLTPGSGYGDLTGESVSNLMDGSDAAKIQVYFSALGQDPDFKGILKTEKQAAFLGSSIDQTALSIVPGARASTAVGRIFGGAAVNMTVGAAGNLIIENAQAALQNEPERYTDTFKEITKTAGQGAAINFAIGTGFAAVFEVGSATRILFKAAPKSDLAPTGSLWWKKAANPLEVEGAISKLGGAENVPETLYRQLDPKTRDSAWTQWAKMDALQKDASKVDLSPIDTTALAAIDLPDVRFAPKDWASPTSSGFNVWEYVPGKNGRAPLTLTGEAKSISELRSILADKMVARYGMVDDLSSPMSMVQGSDLLLEGRMRYLADKAYDPFADIPSVEDFISPTKRGYISPTEAQDAAYAAVSGGGSAFKVKIDVDESLASRIVNKKSLLDDASSLRIVEASSDEANALVVLNRAASGDVVQSANAWAQKASNAGGGWSAEEARKFYLIHHGFDGIADSATKTFEAFFPSKVKWITDQIDKATGALRPVTQARLAQSGAVGNKIFLSSKIKASLGPKTLASNGDALATVAMAKFKGTLQSDDVGNFVKQLSSAKGVSAKTVKVEIARGKSNVVDGEIASAISRDADGALVVRVPESITTYKGQRDFVDSLLSDIDKLGAEVVKPGRNYVPLKSDAFAKAAGESQSRFTLPFDDEAANAIWLDSVAQSQLGKSRLMRRPDNGYDLRDQNGAVTQSFKDIYEARDALVIESLDQKFLRGDLYKQGYALSGSTQKGFTLSGPGLSKPIYSTDLKGLLSTVNYRPSKISNRLAPSEVIIDRSSTTLKFDGKSLAASPEKIARALSKFENPDELAKMSNIKKSMNGDVFKIDENYFRVDVPKLGMTRHFTDAAEAKAFLDSDFASMDMLKTAAERKGLSLFYDVDSGGYVLGDGANIYRAQNADDVQKLLRDRPDVSGGREILSSLDPQADEAVKQILDELDPKLLKEWRESSFNQSMVKVSADALDSYPTPATKGLYKPIPETGRTTTKLRHVLRNNMSTWDYYTESTIRQELGLPDLANGMRQYKHNYRVYEVERPEWLNVAGSMMSDARGRPYKADRANAILAYREAQGNPELLAKTADQFGPLSAREQWSLDLTTKFFDKAAIYFGVDPKTYLNNYMSHIRDYVLSHWDECSTMVDAQELLTKSFGSWEKVPAKLKPYFKYERADALLTAAMEHDPIKIFQRYVDQGLKEKYLQKPVQDILDYLRTHGDVVDADVQQAILQRIAFTSGSGDVAGMERATQFIEGVYRVFKKEAPAPGTGGNLFQAYLNSTYLGAVGFRPWSAARQFLQPMQMLAPRVGIEPVAAAQKKILGPQGKAIMDRMRSEGTLLSAPPMTTEMTGTKLSRLTQKSMQMMWNTDDYARAVSAVFAEDALDSAIALANAGKLQRYKWAGKLASAESRLDSVDIKKFHEKAFMDRFGADNLTGEGQEFTDKITKMALSGDPRQIKDAKVLYGQKVASETNPDMSKFGQPLVFQDNVAGVLFGKFGTWSQTYRENLYRGWKNSNGFAKKSAYVARFIGIQLAIHQALTTGFDLNPNDDKTTIPGLGINSTDMMPGSSALFGGGPAATQIIAAFQAGGQGQQGKDALNTILRALSPAVPAQGGSLIDLGNLQLGPNLKWNLPKIVPGSLQAHYATQFFKALDDYSTAKDSADLWRAFLAATSTPALK